MMVTSANMFDLLGAGPAIGRGFRPDEGSSDAIVLSDGMWRRLGANPDIAGTKLRVGPDTHTVIGVMRPDFGFTCVTAQIPDVYVPFDITKVNPENYDFTTVMRARHGTSSGTVRQAVDAFGRSLDELARQRHDVKIYAVGLQADLVKQVRPALLAMSFAGVFLVLVLTVNLASLLLSRAAEREKQFAVSRALGASGPAVVRATILEGGILGLIGGATGTLVGIWGTRLLLTLWPLDLPRRETIALDWGIAVVVITVGILLGIVAAAVPATWAARVSLASLVSGVTVRGGASSGRMRRSLIVVQVALSLVLLSAAGLVVRSFELLREADPGFRSEGVLTMRLSTRVLTNPADAAAFHERTTAALQTLPGVTGVSATDTLPLSGEANV